LSLKRKTGKVLNDVSGILRPGRLCVILGESGAGKSTLIGLLSGQVPFAQCELEGEMMINDETIDISGWVGSEKSQKLTAIVPQEDILHNQLSVYENLYWCGRFQMSSEKSLFDLKSMVKKYLHLLRLWHVRHKVVTCLSGGERRRTSLGVALMAQPLVLFCDEPTSGLDASNSVIIMRILKQLAVEENTIVVCSCHQPRQAVSEHFDDLILMGNGGHMLFSGCARSVSSYFKGLGHSCPSELNITDYILDLSTSKNVTEDSHGFFANEWKASKPQNKTDIIVKEDISRVKILIKSIKRPSPFLQFRFQIRRNLVMLKRDGRRVLVNALTVCIASFVLTTVQGTLIIASDNYEYQLSPNEITTEDFPLAQLFLFVARPTIYSQQ